MSAPIRELLASISGIEVGRLRDQGNIWSFQYSSDWLTSGDAFGLAPSLPLQKDTIADGATERPVQWFFDNLLPEEQARDVLAKEAAVASSDAFGLLATTEKNLPERSRLLLRVKCNLTKTAIAR